MRFDQDAIRQIHARIDIASFVGSYVPLRKRGNDLVGLCPFHSEKTPSFHVHPDKGFFKCFGCGAGGDVIAFLSKLENLQFPDAVRMLASRAGIELEPESPQSARRRSEREAIYEANRVAEAFFEAALKGPEGEKARRYCEQRGISAAMLERFRLGYAPDRWDALKTELERSGLEAEIGVKAGLLKRGERGCYDFYRDRLMVPTHATTGEVIAFGGRALGEAEPKYLNTSTTPVYTKGHHLFALNLARRPAAKDRRLIVVEGYLDCIALHQAGFEYAVASLGTAFTSEQARELTKYADGIFLCFDGDTAGNDATAKAIEIAVQAIEHAGSAVRVVVLPPGDDPDTFVRKNGAPAFQKLLESALPAIEFRLEREAERLTRGFVGAAQIVPRAEDLIRRMTPRAEWDRWRVWIAKRLKVNENDLRNSRFLADGANFSPRSTGAAPGSRHIPPQLQPAPFETEVLSIMLEEPQLLREYRARIPAERFRGEAYRRVYARMSAQAESLEAMADVFALFADDNEGVAVLSALGQRDRSSTLRYAGIGERRAHLDRVVERLQLDDQRERYAELSRKIDELSAAGQNISAELRGEFDTLVAKLKR